MPDSELDYIPLPPNSPESERSETPTPSDPGISLFPGSQHAQMQAEYAILESFGSTTSFAPPPSSDVPVADTAPAGPDSSEAAVSDDLPGAHEPPLDGGDHGNEGGEADPANEGQGEAANNDAEGETPNNDDEEETGNGKSRAQGERKEDGEPIPVGRVRVFPYCDDPVYPRLEHFMLAL